jgi:hypothetical protein
MSQADYNLLEQLLTFDIQCLSLLCVHAINLIVNDSKIREKSGWKGCFEVRIPMVILVITFVIRRIFAHDMSNGGSWMKFRFQYLFALSDGAMLTTALVTTLLLKKSLSNTVLGFCIFSWPSSSLCPTKD